MELQSGKTYKSPRHGRRIKVMSILDQGDSVVLAIYWIEDYGDFDEVDEITVSKEDIKDWKLVN